MLGYRLGVRYTARVLIYRLGARISVGARIQGGCWNTGWVLEYRLGARIQGGC